MTTVTIKEARDQFAEIINRTAYGKERVLLTRRGKAVAALVPVEVLEQIAVLEEMEDELDIRDAIAAYRQAKQAGTVSWEDLKAELNL